MRLLVSIAAGLTVLLAADGVSAESRPAARSKPCAYLDYAQLPAFIRSASVWLDRSGIPRVRYSSVNPRAYNPVTIAQYGLQEYSYFALGRGPEHLAAARRAGEWLLRAQERESGKWLYRFDWTVLGTRLRLRAPWASAMAQGQAISLLVRLYAETRDRRYLESAGRAVRPLTRRVRAGGLVTRLAGRPFYEEYPTTPPSYVLNGFMFTLLGLRDLDGIDPSLRTRLLHRRGLATLVAVLPLYDRGRSLYHLAHLGKRRQSPFLAPLRYQRLHVKLLTALAATAHRPRLGDYAARWRRSLPNASSTRGRHLALCAPRRSDT